MIPVRFNPSNYSVTEGVDSNAVITLEALVAHPFAFTVAVLTQDGSAFGESCCHTYSACILMHILAECTYNQEYLRLHEAHPTLEEPQSPPSLLAILRGSISAAWL